MFALRQRSPSNKTEACSPAPQRVRSTSPNPVRTHGRCLLAHELAHVVQQQGKTKAAMAAVQRQATPSTVCL